MAYNKTSRPSPTDSATWYNPGTYKRGNDGQMYTIVINSVGIHRWITALYGNTVEHLIPNSKHPLYIGTHKFKVGDMVRVVKSGSGCGSSDIGQEVFITELGNYVSQNDGYKVSPPIGNSMTMSHNGFIGESSFKLISSIKPVKLNKKINLNKMAKTTKRITKKTTQEVRKIETSLVNKEEVFKMLALAEATGLPLLLVGDPGTAKTKTVIEYAKAWLNKDGKMTAEDFATKLFILETDEGTKASEIKGMPNLETLFTHNKFELNAPIADAEIVVINEVDKASSGIRNAMLGVMNEKFLFNGKSKIPCKWKLFVATCNEIPKDEKNSPFWDRFMLKMEVTRISAGEMAKYYEKGARSYRENITLGVPNKSEIDSIEIPTKKLEKYLEVGYTNSSDRTLTFVPLLSKAISFIWDSSIDSALIKTAQIMIDSTAGSELKNKLISAEMKAIISKVEMLNSYSQNEQLELAVGEIESLINAYASRGQIDESQVQEIESSMSYIIENHPAKKEYSSLEEFDSLSKEYEADHTTAA